MCERSEMYFVNKGRLILECVKSRHFFPQNTTHEVVLHPGNDLLCCVNRDTDAQGNCSTILPSEKLNPRPEYPVSCR